MKSCKLPKAVTDVAIPRRVRAACEIHGGERVFFVRGDDGRPASRFFATGRGFASHVRHSYKPVAQLGSSKTKLDLILDKVKRGVREVTFDVEGYTKEQVERLRATAKARGLHVSGTNRWVLVRDL